MRTGRDAHQDVAASGVGDRGERRTDDGHLGGAEGALGPALEDPPANRSRPLGPVRRGIHFGERDLQPTGVCGGPLHQRELRARGDRGRARENDDLPVHLLEVEIGAREHVIERVRNGRGLARAIHPVSPVRKEARTEGDRHPRLLRQERQRLRQRNAVHDDFRPLRQEPAVVLHGLRRHPAPTGQGDQRHESELSVPHRPPP